MSSQFQNLGLSYFVGLNSGPARWAFAHFKLSCGTILVEAAPLPSRPLCGDRSSSPRQATPGAVSSPKHTCSIFLCSRQLALCEQPDSRVMPRWRCEGWQSLGRGAQGEAGLSVFTAVPGILGHPGLRLPAPDTAAPGSCILGTHF